MKHVYIYHSCLTFQMQCIECEYSNFEFELELEKAYLTIQVYIIYDKEHVIKKLYKYSRETKAKVHAYRYRHSHPVG